MPLLQFWFILSLFVFSAMAQAPQPNATNDTDNINTLAHFNDVSGTIVTAGVTLQQFTVAGASSAISTVIAVNMIQYVRFINIDYPTDLERLYKEQGLKTTHFNFGPYFPNSLKPTAKKYPAKDKFAVFQASSLYIANFWKTIITIPFLIVGAIVVLLVGKINLKYPLLVKGYELIRSFVVWNFIISFVMSNIDALTLWSLIEFKNLRLDSSLAGASFALNLILLLTTLVLMGGFVWKVWSIRKKEKLRSVEEKEKQHDSIKVLYEDLKCDHLHQELFFVTFVLRIVINNTIIAVLESALLQCWLLLSTNVLMLLYIIIYRPYNEKLKNVEQLCYEAVTVIVNISCIRISSMDQNQQGLAVAEADAIISSNVLMAAASLFFTVLRNVLMILSFIQFVRKQRQKRKSGKTSPAKAGAGLGLAASERQHPDKDLEDAKSQSIDSIPSEDGEIQKVAANLSFDLESRNTKVLTAAPSLLVSDTVRTSSAPPDDIKLVRLQSSSP